MNATGGGEANLTDDDDDDVEPAWSPDGTKIAFTTNRDAGINDPNREVYVMSNSGSGQTNLTNNPAIDSEPDWQPSCDPTDTTDTDGDALRDCWETGGIDSDGDGTDELDLPAMGAKPRHKDIFLEIDSMPGRVLSPTAIDRAVASFAAAPVSNPDGSGGIRLHVDSGPASVMNPVTGETWGSLSDADPLTFQNVLGSFEPNDDYNWSAFDVIKGANFSPDREPAFHYAVAGNQYGHASNTSSGISRGIGASDLLVTLGAFPTPGGTISQQAGTLMHELGHNLELRHGGDDDLHYKASYLSIMNYSFQMGGLLRADGTRVLDYSRLAIGLNESGLDEATGFGYPPGSDPAQFITLTGCPNVATPIGEPGTLFDIPLLAGGEDWNCDGDANDGVVAADVNGDGLITAFNPFLDWPNLAFDGGGVGDAAGAPLPQTTQMIEPQADELLENEKVLEEAVDEGGGPSANPPAGDVTPPAGDGVNALSFGAKTLVTLRLAATRIPAQGPLNARVANANSFRITGALSARTTNRASRSRTLQIKVQARPFSVGAQAKKTVRLRLPRALRRLLSRSGKLSLLLIAKVKDPAGNTRSVKRNVAVKLKRKSR